MTPEPIGDALGRSLVATLGRDCLAGAAVARVLLNSGERTFDLTSLTSITPGSLARVTADFVDRGWLISDSGKWRRGPSGIPTGLPAFLEGAGQMRSVLSEDSGVAAVVTFPNAPSAIAAALPATGLAHAGLISTEETLIQIADAALSRFTIASPFLNAAGLDAAIQLFGRTRAENKRLVTRCTDEVQVAIQSRLIRLRSAGVEVLDYYLSTELGFETFHAKIVLADQDLAYVGSANMTLYTRRSMELGVLVEGRPAKVIASAVRAMEKISRSVAL